MSNTEKQKLRSASLEVSCWSASLTHTWRSRDEDYTWVIGHVDEDGTKYTVARVEADAYDYQGVSEKLADFFRLATPSAVLALLDEVAAANANHENAVAHMQTVCAERDQLKAENAELRRIINQSQSSCSEAIREFEKKGWHGSSGYHAGLLKAAEIASEVEGRAMTKEQP